VKVVDFGIAKAAASDEQKVTKTGMVVGTPEYMSPEQLSGDPLDARSDIYALGLVTFNMLTGTLPFPGESAQETMIMRLTDDPRPLSAMRPDIAWPAELQRVMDKALARDANQRYRNASEYAHDLVQAIDRMPASSLSTAGTQIVSTMTPHEAATAATMQVQAPVPKTRIAGKDEVVGRTAEDLTDRPIGRPAGASPAATPTKSKAPVFIGAGLLAAAGIVFAVMKMQSSPATSVDSTALNTPSQSESYSNRIAGGTNPQATAETDTALAALNVEAADADSDDKKALVLSKLSGLKPRISTPDQRVVAAIIEALALPDDQICVPLRAVSQQDLTLARTKTAEEFGTLSRDCKGLE
jgi:serine/threonine protein kinase